MARRYMKRYSTLPIIRMQIKTTVTYNLTLSVLSSRTPSTTNVVQDVLERNFIHC